MVYRFIFSVCFTASALVANAQDSSPSSHFVFVVYFDGDIVFNEVRVP